MENNLNNVSGQSGPTVTAMYTFIIKEKGAGIVVTRALIALAGIAALFNGSGTHQFIRVLCAIVLLFTAAALNRLTGRYGIGKFLLLLSSAILLFVATGSITFAVILLLFGSLVKLLHGKISIEVSGNGVKMNKLLGGSTYGWNEFENVVLKDRLLTLDFKNNRLLQVNIDDTQPAVDEDAFNAFCLNNNWQGNAVTRET